MYEQLSKIELRGKEYERLERLYFEVENACQMAEQLGAEDVFGGDMYIVSILLSKVSPSSFDKWLEFAEQQEGPVETGRGEWAVFRSWLLSCYKKAKRARIATQAAPRGPVVTTAAKRSGGVAMTVKPSVICSRCREPGHRREQCPQPATSASINAVQV